MWLGFLSDEDIRPRDPGMVELGFGSDNTISDLKQGSGIIVSQQSHVTVL